MSDTKIKLTLGPKEVETLQAVAAMRLCSLGDALRFLIAERDRMMKEWFAKANKPAGAKPRGRPAKPKPAETME